MANKNKSIKIPDQLFATLDFLDKQFREHKYLMGMMNEEIIRTQGAILQKENPELFEQVVKGFCRMDTDWKNKTIVIIPTDDPQKKGEEVAEAIEKNNHDKNTN